MFFGNVDKINFSKINIKKYEAFKNSKKYKLDKRIIGGLLSNPSLNEIFFNEIKDDESILDIINQVLNEGYADINK